jgi:hypothetical protein
VDWKNIDLIALMAEHKNNFSKIGRLLDVSDNAVRKRFFKISKIINGF